MNFNKLSTLLLIAALLICSLPVSADTPVLLASNAQDGVRDNAGCNACEIISSPTSFEFNLNVWDSWSSGYCADITVTNTADKVTHYPYGVTFSLSEDTKISGSWSGDVQRNGENVTVIFPSWTSNIDSNSKSDDVFGFCTSGTSRPSKLNHYEPDFTKLQFEFRVHDQWAEGYCGKVWVTYSGSEPYIPAPNEFILKLSQSSHITELWNESYILDGENVTVNLPYWSSHLNKGESVDIGTGICVDGDGVPYNMVAK